MKYKGYKPHWRNVFTRLLYKRKPPAINTTHVLVAGTSCAADGEPQQSCNVFFIT
jgi:hypothetical protein